jgi:hypothetical protein
MVVENGGMEAGRDAADVGVVAPAANVKHWRITA